MISVCSLSLLHTHCSSCEPRKHPRRPPTLLKGKARYNLLPGKTLWTIWSKKRGDPLQDYTEGQRKRDTYSQHGRKIALVWWLTHSPLRSLYMFRVCTHTQKTCTWWGCADMTADSVTDFFYRRPVYVWKKIESDWLIFGPLIIEIVNFLMLFKLIGLIFSALN